jgi:hypothetical protein
MHKQNIPDALDKASLVENPLRVSANSTKRMQGGERATDNSVHTYQSKPYLYTSAGTAKTTEGGDVYISGAKLGREMTQKTYGTAVANKTYLSTDQTRNEDIYLSHPMQQVMPISTTAVKTFVGSDKNPMQDTTVALHNQKRTPLHSVVTNAQAPVGKVTMPENVPDQKRRIPLMQTATTGFNAEQIQMSADVYSIQARGGGLKNTHDTLQKGGFDAQGSAVPVFDQYENYNYSITDPLRDQLRQRTLDVFNERNPSQPMT